MCCHPPNVSVYYPQHHAELKKENHDLKKQVDALKDLCWGHQKQLDQHKLQCRMAPTPTHYYRANQTPDSFLIASTSFDQPGSDCRYPSAELTLTHPPGTGDQQRQVCQRPVPVIASHTLRGRGYQQQACQPVAPVSANQAPEFEDYQLQAYQKSVSAVSANRTPAPLSQQPQLYHLTAAVEHLYDEVAAFSSRHSDVMTNSVTTRHTASSFGESRLISVSASNTSDFSPVQSSQLQHPFGPAAKCGFVTATDHMEALMTQFLPQEDYQKVQLGVGAEETALAQSGGQAKQPCSTTAVLFSPQQGAATAISHTASPPTQHLPQEDVEIVEILQGLDAQGAAWSRGEAQRLSSTTSATFTPLQGLCASQGPQISTFNLAIDAPQTQDVRTGGEASHQSRMPGEEVDTMDDLLSILREMTEDAGKEHVLKPAHELPVVREESEDLKRDLTDDAFETSQDPIKSVMGRTSTEATNTTTNMAKLQAAENFPDPIKPMVDLGGTSNAGPELPQAPCLSTMQNVRMRPGIQHVTEPTPIHRCSAADTSSQSRGKTTLYRLW